MTAPHATAPPRLRIAVLNRSFISTGGGAERYSIALVEKLASRHEIHVFAQNIEHSFPGVHYHHLWTPSARPRWINQLWFAVSSWWATRRGFDVVHSHENTWHGEVQTVHVLPVKYTLFHQVKGFRFWLRWLKVISSPRLIAYLLLEKARFKVRKKRCIVGTSPSLTNILTQIYPEVVGMLSTITPGVESVRRLVDADAQCVARKQLGLPQFGRCVLFVANDYEKKGLKTLIEAMSFIPSPSFLVVVGNASHIRKYEAIASNCGVSDRVYFLGPLADMDAPYAAADCLAHPTLEDTFAMVVLEAMAHGLPVVVSDRQHCGISEMLLDGRQALILSNPKDPKELGVKISCCLDDRCLRESLSYEGSLFAKLFLWESIADVQEQMYQGLAASTGSLPIR
jgi:UDP-glucose:(heptosyl)LPS alpha-1,3-glucosyltransferase